jgi:hypothetical protein
VELEELQFRTKKNKVWIVGLMHQIHFMISGNGVTSKPLPIENLVSLPLRRPNSVMITSCPICGMSYAYNNIVVSSCGCTYHLFCLGINLESKPSVCVGCICGKALSMDWMTSVGFQQINMLLKKPKLERANPKAPNSNKENWLSTDSQ